ncbi:GumC family protein [Syntrophomonas erecta]
MSEQKYDAYNAEDEIEIDLREIITVLKKWSKLIIVMSLLFAFTAGIISFFVLTPIYQAQTLLMVTQATEKLQAAPAQRGEGLEDLVGAVSQIPVWTMSTYLGQIKSEALMKRIIEKLDLPYTAAELSGMIEATVVKDSNLIDVKVTNADPELAARIGNTLSTEYLQLMTDKNQEQLTRSVAFLEKQKNLTDQELYKATEALKEFQRQPGGVEVLEAEFASKSEDVVKYSSRLKILQVEVQQMYSGIASLEQDLNAIPHTVSVENWTEGRMVTSQELNPLYVSLAQQVAEKKASLAEKQGELEGLQYLVESLYVEIDGLQAELAEKRVEQDRLAREVERLKQTSETLAQKGTETQIAKSIDLGDTSVMVVSEASIPAAPIKPNKKLNIAIAFILGIILFTLLAFILEYLDNTIKSPDDINRELELPVLGVIPKMTAQNTGQSPYGG